MVVFVLLKSFLILVFNMLISDIGKQTLFLVAKVKLLFREAVDVYCFLYLSLCFIS